MSSHPHFLGSMTLKALLEDPNLKNPPVIGQSGNQEKVKKEGGSDRPQYNYGSAFLGPALWDKSYGMELNLEYMDLDEFLSESDMPVIEEDALTSISSLSKAEDPLRLQSGANTPQHPVVTSPRQYLRTPPVSPSHYLKSAVTTSIPTIKPSTQSPPRPEHGHSPSSSPSSSSSSSPGSPFKVDFQVSEQDIALTSIPDYDDPRYYPNAQGWIEGRDDHRPKMGICFDPRKRNFSEEELKPQPILKKSRKIFVPDELKDDKYWARRVKNNCAAKRSRDARRVKENQIALRAAYLEKENKCLRDEMSKLRKENAKLKTVADKYEPETAAAASPVSWPGLSS